MQVDTSSVADDEKALPSLDLHFPDAPDFVSRPPRLTLAEQLRVCEANLEAYGANTEAFERRRLEMKVKERFRLD